MDLLTIVFQAFQLLSQPLSDNVAGGTNRDEGRFLAALRDAGFGECLKPCRRSSRPSSTATMAKRAWRSSAASITRSGTRRRSIISRSKSSTVPGLFPGTPGEAVYQDSGFARFMSYYGIFQAQHWTSKSLFAVHRNCPLPLFVLYCIQHENRGERA